MLDSITACDGRFLLNFYIRSNLSFRGASAVPKKPKVEYNETEQIRRNKDKAIINK